jgi:hypothetical protein
LRISRRRCHQGCQRRGQCCIGRVRRRPGASQGQRLLFCPQAKNSQTYSFPLPSVRISIKRDLIHSQKSPTCVSQTYSFPLPSVSKCTDFLEFFYSAPRLSADGDKLVYVTWNHPNMPWDVTMLAVTSLDHAGIHSQKSSNSRALLAMY